MKCARCQRDLSNSRYVPEVGSEHVFCSEPCYRAWCEALVDASEKE